MKERFTQKMQAKTIKLLEMLDDTELVQLGRVLITYINNSFSTSMELPDFLERIVDECYNIYKRDGDEEFIHDLFDYIIQRINGEDDKADASNEYIKQKTEEKTIKLLEMLDYTELIQVSRVLITYINSSFSTRTELPSYLGSIVDVCYYRYEKYRDIKYINYLLDYINYRIKSEDDKTHFSNEYIRKKFSGFFI